MNVLTDFSHVAPDILERAGKFGTAVHTLIELYETKRLDREMIDPILETILCAWERCKADNDIRVFGVEMPVVSTKYRYAGRFDVAASMRGINGLIEIKSRPYNPMVEKLQTIAYMQAYNESHPGNRVYKRFFCGFDLEGEYDFKEIKRVPGEPDHLSMFLSVLAIYQWKGAYK